MGRGLESIDNLNERHCDGSAFIVFGLWMYLDCGCPGSRSLDVSGLWVSWLVRVSWFDGALPMIVRFRSRGSNVFVSTAIAGREGAREQVGQLPGAVHTDAQAPPIPVRSAP